MLYPPANPANDVAILFIETSGCLPMCGHGTIGTVTMMLEEGLVAPKVPGELVGDAGRAGRSGVPTGGRTDHVGAAHERALVPLPRKPPGGVS